MIEPLRCRCISGTAARDQSQVPPTLVRNTASQSAGSVVSTVPPQEKPAAVISTSSLPCRAMISPTVVRAKLAAPTSPTCIDASLFAPEIAANVSCKPGASRSTKARDAPSFANSNALARPMPDAAPVTTAVRPINLMSRPLYTSSTNCSDRPPNPRSRTAPASRILAPAARPKAARGRRHYAGRPSALHRFRPVGK